MTVFFVFFVFSTADAVIGGRATFSNSFTIAYGKADHSSSNSYSTLLTRYTSFSARVIRLPSL